MILYELAGGTEDNPAYQTLEATNAVRHYHFLHSAVLAALSTRRLFLSQTLLKAFNYHAIACLHTKAGEFRPCPMEVGNHPPPDPRNYRAPDPHRVQDLMDDFVNFVNLKWETTEPVPLASYVLWRLTHIHPFINGNGRTARAACYFVLCAKAGGLLGGEAILPELLRQNRQRYVEALKAVDSTYTDPVDEVDLSPVVNLVNELLEQQLQA